MRGDDPALARDLAWRTGGSNVTVLCEDASAMSLPDQAFDAAVSLTMLHHVASAALQDRVLAEVARGRSARGGTFAGTDSVSSPFFRLLRRGGRDVAQGFTLPSVEQT